MHYYMFYITFTHEIKTQINFKDMKAIETFFESTNFDHKNITNKSNVVLTESNIETLENEGATYELLETLNVPVFKYRTQITIHGLFPTLSNHYIGGYKNLFQNKNLSIGVKYNAIDRMKKERIFNAIKGFLNVDGVFENKWLVANNSTEYNIYKCSGYFNTRAEYLTLLPKYEAEAKEINEKLFFGNVQVYSAQSVHGYFLVLALNIGAIKNENIVPLIENICGTDINTVEAKILADKQAYELKQANIKLERETAQLLKQEAAKPYFDKAHEYIKLLGYEKQPIQLYDGLIILTQIIVVNESFDIIYKFRKYNKTKAQKQFRFINVEYKNEIPEILEFVYNGYSDNKSTRSEIIGYVKNTNNNNNPTNEKKEMKNEPTTTKVKETTNEQNKPTFTNLIRVVEYSEKSFAIVGDTKPIKEILLNLGGKYNRYLTCGIGWIFSNKKRSEVMLKLNLI